MIFKTYQYTEAINGFNGGPQSKHSKSTMSIERVQLTLAGLAQLVERQTFNLNVRSSSLLTGGQVSIFFSKPNLSN